MRIHRHTGFWFLAGENLFRHKAKNFAVFVPLTIVVASLGVITFVKDGLVRDSELAVAFLPDLTIQQTTGGRVERVSTDVCEDLRHQPHVKSVAPRVWGYLPAEDNGKSIAYTIMGIDLDEVKMGEQKSLFVREGRFLSMKGENECVIGEALARGLGVALGDTIEIRDTFNNEDSFHVVGLFVSSVQIYAADLLLTDIASAGRFFGYGENECSDICVYLDHSGYAGTVAQEVSSKSPNLRILSKETLGNVTRQAFSGRGGVFQLLWLILLLTSVLIAWSQASHISLERKREIGIFKAVGWEIMDVIELNLIEVTLLGLLAWAGGLALSLGYVLIGAPGVKSYFLGWATLFPEFPIPIVVSVQSVLLLFAICLVPLWLATVIPAWLLGVVEPDRAIRG